MKTLQFVETSGTPNIKTQRHTLEDLNTEGRFCVLTEGQMVRVFIESWRYSMTNERYEIPTILL